MMIKIPDFLINSLQDISNPAGIIDEKYNVFYVNRLFEDLFKIRISAKNRAKCEMLKTLKLEPVENKVVSPQYINFSGQQQKLIISVYLLNKNKKTGNYFLIIVRNEEKKAEKSYRAKSSNPYEDEEDFRTEKLSEEFSELVGENTEFKKALIIAQRAAKSNISVLITGESGTGKEILAHAIHKTSLRRAKPLIDVNCAAIPDTLIESELFGYEKGAFTGAKTEGSRGYFDEAHEGTILLDEVGDASLQTQSKLLRVLESGIFKRVGGTKNIKVDVRVISSTNRDLTFLVEQKAFREDLYFRLNAFTIYLPPLRERREDISLLIDYFLKSNDDIEKRNFTFSSSSMEILNSYHWPGNVRELKGVVSYAVNMSKDSIVSPSSLPNFLFAPKQERIERTLEARNLQNAIYNLPQAMENLEKKLIKEALETTKNKTLAMKKLGISRRTFYIKMKKYGFD